MKERWIIMDVNTGVDDSMAIMLAGAQKHLHILALTSVFGNNAAELTAYNTRKIAELLGIDVPVARGSERPMIDDPIDYTAGLGPLIHGRDGLGNVGDRLPEPSAALSPLTAVDLMAQTIRKCEEKVTIVATGPLTNIAVFLLSYPDLTDRIEEIAIMGGAAFGGNLSFSVEANIGHDPEAAAIVFRSPVRKTVFGLDATMGVYMTDEEREMMAETGKTGQFLKDCLQPYADIYRQLADWPGAVLHDSLPVAWLIDETLFDMKPVRITIELNGRYSRGATVCNFNTEDDTCRIAMGADRKGIIDLHLNAVKQYS